MSPAWPWMSGVMSQLPRRFLIVLLLLSLLLAGVGALGGCLAITAFCVFVVWVYWPRRAEPVPLGPPAPDSCPACGAILSVEYLSDILDITPAPEHPAVGGGWTWLRCGACGAHCVDRFSTIEVMDPDEWRSTTRYGIAAEDYWRSIEQENADRLAHPHAPPAPDPRREAVLDGLLCGALASAAAACTGALWNLLVGHGLGLERATLLGLLLAGGMLAALVAAAVWVAQAKAGPCPP